MANPRQVWERFFEDCDLPQRQRQQYAETFVTQRIQPYMLKDLTKDELRELNVNTLGDQLAILRYIKQTDGGNAPAFRLIKSSTKDNAPTSSKDSNEMTANLRVMKAKATSSGTPLQSRSVVIRKKEPNDMGRVLTGLRSDMIIKEKSGRLHRTVNSNLPTSSYERPVHSHVARNNLSSRLNQTRTIIDSPERRFSNPIGNDNRYTTARVRERITYTRRRAEPSYTTRRRF